MMKSTLEFIEKYGEDAFTKICEEACEKVWNKSTIHPEVTIEDTVQHDACNHTHYGYILIHPNSVSEEEVYFELADGNNNGSQIIAFNYSPIEVDESYTEYFFEPTNPADNPERKVFIDAIMKAWKPELDNKMCSMNYDYRFAPGLVTENHYSEWAAKKGLKISYRVVNQKKEMV